jgi:hypothetical protein
MFYLFQARKVVDTPTGRGKQPVLVVFFPLFEFASSILKDGEPPANFLPYDFSSLQSLYKI